MIYLCRVKKQLQKMNDDKNLVEHAAPQKWVFTNIFVDKGE